MCNSIVHWAPFWAQNDPKPCVAFQLRGKEKGGAMMSGPLVNGSNQTVVPFQFPFIILLHV
jgi:hypothetical protein